MMIRVSQLLHDGPVTGRHSGRLLWEAVYSALASSESVIVDFDGVELLTQSAADEFIGRIVRQHADFVGRISFSNCSGEVSGMLQWAAEHAHSAFQDQGGLVSA